MSPGFQARLILMAVAAVGISNAPLAAQETETTEKPNILFIWGDDLGQSNISAYTRGLMGYETPYYIDRIAAPSGGRIFQS